MNHPEYPLMHEQRAEIIMCDQTAEAVLKIQRHFAKRRDAEFPGWREQYERDVRAWVAWHSNRRRSA